MSRLLNPLRPTLPVAGWLVSTVLTLCVYGARAPQVFRHPQLWAEDGVVFMRSALTEGAQSIITPYAGYLHLYPRLGALVAARFSAVHTPAIYAAFAVMAVAWASATIATTELPYAWLLGIALMLPPHSGEVFGTLTNVQWLMAPALALVFCTTSPQSSASRANQIIFCAVAGLTGPFSLCLIPVCVPRLWQAIRRREFHGISLTIVIFACAAIHAGFMLSGSDVLKGTDDPVGLVAILLDRGVGQLVLEHHSQTFQDFLADGALVITVVLVPRYARITFGALFVFSAIFFGMVWIKFLPYSPLQFDGIANGDRYFFIPRVFLLWAALMTAISGGHTSSKIAFSVLALIIFNDVQWQKPLLPILPWKEQAKALDRGEAVSIAINPTEGDSSWMLTIPARKVP